MIVEVDERFVKDIKNLHNKSLKLKIAYLIENVRVLSGSHEIKGIKKL